jgi:hypothetical protein
MNYTLTISIKTPDASKCRKLLNALSQADMENTSYKKFMPEERKYYNKQQ